MILTEYNEEINSAKHPKYKAMDIACQLNQKDPFNTYFTTCTMTYKKKKKKVEIKGMK